jgi:hypothetical protein
MMTRPSQGQASIQRQPQLLILSALPAMKQGLKQTRQKVKTGTAASKELAEAP